MFQKRAAGGTAALLNRVTHQLKGEKVEEEDEDDGLGVSTTNLTFSLLMKLNVLLCLCSNKLKTVLQFE